MKEEQLVKDHQHAQALESLLLRDNQISALEKEHQTVRNAFHDQEIENKKLHKLVTEGEQFRLENIRIAGEIAYLKENEETLQQTADYHKKQSDSLRLTAGNLQKDKMTLQNEIDKLRES